MTVAQPRVVLVSMPWAPVTEPSLALGILHAQLRKAGINSRVLHANIALLRYVTFETYVRVADMWALNEFVFTEALSPGVDDAQLEALIERCVTHVSNSGHRHSRYTTVRSTAEMLLRFRDEVAPAFLDECADEILADNPTLVGLTCLFDQTAASAALAKVIKEKASNTIVALGGYALQGPPGDQLLNAFQWIDCIARGDGEPIIEDLAWASVGALPLNQIAGLLLRGQETPPPRNIPMDLSPDPDYEDWFADVVALEQNCDVKIRSATLPVESSRGCWWGQVHHCVFCGIDDDALTFRHKSADRVMAMLDSMRSRYGEHEFRFSDYILPRPYWDELLPRLAEITPKYNLKCEIKANQTHDRVRQLAQAGFREVQPGIESFSSEVLRLMDKGVSGIQNVALLKYGYRERIVIHYNFLYGLPGERASEYRDLLRNIPRLYHLTPPVSRTEAIVTRFAPLHSSPERFGAKSKPRHHRCYDVLFSQDTLRSTGLSLDDYAYYFDRYLDQDDEMVSLYAQVVQQINHWKKQHQDNDVYLAYDSHGDTLRFRDSRFGETLDRELSTLESAAYRACDDAPISLRNMTQALMSKRNCSSSAVAAAIARLDEERLLWREGEYVLGLGFPWAIVSQRIESRWNTEWTAVYY